MSLLTDHGFRLSDIHSNIGDPHTRFQEFPLKTALPQAIELGFLEPGLLGPWSPDCCWLSMMN